MDRGSSGHGYLRNVIDLVASAHGALALKADGSVAYWGNFSGGGYESTIAPLRIDKQADTSTNHTGEVSAALNNLSEDYYQRNIVTIAAGVNHALLLDSCGRFVYGFGTAAYHDLLDAAPRAAVPGAVARGNGTQSPNLVKVFDAAMVTSPDYHTYASEFRVTGLAAGYYTSALLGTLLDADGGLVEAGVMYAFGQNNSLQTGVSPTATPKNVVTVPTRVLAGWNESGWENVDNKMIQVRSADFGAEGAVALRADGTVWTWGGNTYGQRGDQSTMGVAYDDANTQVSSTTGRPHRVGDAGYDRIALVDKTTGRFYDKMGTGTGDMVQDYFVTLNGGESVSVDELVRVTGNGFNLYKHTERVVLADASGTGTDTNGNAAPVVSPADSRFLFVPADDRLVHMEGINIVANSLGHYGETTLAVYDTLTGGLMGQIVVTVKRPAEGGAEASFTAPMAAAGDDFTVALRADGTVWTWGRNASGQLGNGTNVDSYSPVQVIRWDGYALENVIAVAAGGSHALAVAVETGTDGGSVNRVYAWGLNANGQLGNGNLVSSNSAAPLNVTFDNKPVVRLAAGAAHSLALTEDGSVYAWGSNAWGQLGVGNNTNASNVRGNVTLPIRVRSLAGGVTEQPWLDTVVAIDAEDNYSLALRADGSVAVWGANNNGQMGKGTVDSAATRVQVMPGLILRGAMGKDTPYGTSGLILTHDEYLRGAITAAAGAEHAAAATGEGNAWAWGLNDVQQVAPSASLSTTRSSLPVQVPATWLDDGAGRAAHVTAHAGQTFFTDNLGTVYAMGRNNVTDVVNSLLGIGAADASTGVPVSVKKETTGVHNGIYYYNTDLNSSLLDKVMSVTVGDTHAVAIRDDGTVYAWGLNNYGQLGGYGNLDLPDTAGSGYDRGLDGYHTSAADNGNAMNRYHATRVGGEDSYTLYLNGALSLPAGGNSRTSVSIGRQASYVTMNAAQTLTVDLTAVTMKLVTGFRLENAADVDDTNALTANERSRTALLSGLDPAYVTVYSSNENIAVAALSGGSILVTPVAGAYGETNILVRYDTANTTEYGLIHVTVLQDNDAVQAATPDVSVKLAAPATAAGRNFTVSLRSDGTVWTWGENGSGQLGNGTNAASNVPVQVVKDANGTPLDNNVSVAAGPD